MKKKIMCKQDWLTFTVGVLLLQLPLLALAQEGTHPSYILENVVVVEGKSPPAESAKPEEPKPSESAPRARIENGKIVLFREVPADMEIPSAEQPVAEAPASEPVAKSEEPAPEAPQSSSTSSEESVVEAKPERMKLELPEYEGLPVLRSDEPNEPAQGYFERARFRGVEMMGGAGFSAGSGTEGSVGSGDAVGRLRLQHYRTQGHGEESSSGTVSRERAQLTGELGVAGTGEKAEAHGAVQLDGIFSRYHTTNAQGAGFAAGGTGELRTRYGYKDMLGSGVVAGATGEIGFDYADPDLRVISTLGLGGSGGVDQYGGILGLDAVARLYLETEDFDLNARMSRTLFGLDTRTEAGADVVARLTKGLRLGVGVDHQIIDDGNREIRATTGRAMIAKDWD